MKRRFFPERVPGQTPQQILADDAPLDDLRPVDMYQCEISALDRYEAQERLGLPEAVRIAIGPSAVIVSLQRAKQIRQWLDEAIFDAETARNQREAAVFEAMRQSALRER